MWRYDYKRYKNSYCCSLFQIKQCKRIAKFQKVIVLQDSVRVYVGQYDKDAYDEGEFFVDATKITLHESYQSTSQYSFDLAVLDIPSLSDSRPETCVGCYSQAKGVIISLFSKFTEALKSLLTPSKKPVFQHKHPRFLNLILKQFRIRYTL